MGRKKHLRTNNRSCGRFSKDGWLECPACDLSYHPKCVGSAEGEVKGSNYKHSYQRFSHRKNSKLNGSEPYSRS